jgi:AraC-like DNA-binding protein
LAVYQLSRPQPELSPYIESYWFVSASAGEPVELTVDVYVDLRADLVFNFGAPYTRTISGGREHTIRHSNLDAQRTRPIKIEQRGDVLITGVRFCTAGLSPFVTGSVCAWNDQVVPIARVFGNPILRLRDRLRATAGDVRGQTALLDEYFAGRFDLTPAKAKVQSLKTEIETTFGLVRMDELCEHAEVSLRQLDRLFRAHLGVGPKAFARVTRFQRALNRLKSDPGCTLAAVAAECGYYDQPHFVRDFKQYAGAIPKDQVGYFPADAPADFSPNLVRFLQDRPRK